MSNELSSEEIDTEIKKVMTQFNSVESIIGKLADENGRTGVVHRELRDFNGFVHMMIFARPEQMSNYDNQFKNLYNNFHTSDDFDSTYDLHKWACLYWIYNKWWEENADY